MKIENLLLKMDEFKSRLVGWDGEGGFPISKTAFEEGKAFLSLLQELNLGLPDSIFAPGDGELTFQWSNPAFCEVAFIGNGTISWAFKSMVDSLWGVDEFLWLNASLPPQLRQFISDRTNYPDHDLR